MRRLAIALIASAAAALGQAPSNTGPMLGFVPGPQPWQLQPILGIPGAARFGNPISLPRSATQLYVAPGQAYALAAQGPANPVALAVLQAAGVVSTNPALTALPGAMTSPDLVAFSPTAQSVALYAQQSGEVQVFSGLPNSPRKAQDISSVGRAALLAVSDDAQSVLISDGVGNVYALAQGAAAVPIYHTEEVSALVFVPQSHDAIVCDPVNGVALTSPAIDGITLVSPPNTCQPQAATTTADGKTLLLACPAAHLIWSIDRASGSIDFHSVSNMPYGFTSLGLRDTFVMTPTDGYGTYWLFAWQNGEPKSFFVPAARNTGAGN